MSFVYGLLYTYNISVSRICMNSNSIANLYEISWRNNFLQITENTHGVAQNNL